MTSAPHLAQLNIGRLVAEPGDPRVAGFMAALDRINGLGKRMPGFVWMMAGADPALGNTGTKIGGDPRFVANLTVWESVETLERFVFNTLHRQFYERRQEWFEVLGARHFVMWAVPAGRRPTLAEGLERLAHLKAHGASDHAFDWAFAKDARLWRAKSGPATAAE
jgi:hypothetical protein